MMEDFRYPTRFENNFDAWIDDAPLLGDGYFFGGNAALISSAIFSAPAKSFAPHAA